MSLAPYILKGKEQAAVGQFNYTWSGNNSGIVAHSGGGKANATPLTASFNLLSTVAAAADSVLLPPSVDGLSVYIYNAGASSTQVFGSGTDTIDSVATATGVPLAAGKRALFFCFAPGAWVSAQLGVVSA